MQGHSVAVFRCNTAMTIGERIKAEMRARLPPADVKQLARATGLATSTIYDLLRGDSASTTKLHAVAEFLGVRPHWLETGQGPKFTTSDLGAITAPDPFEKYEFATRVYGAVLSAGNGSTHWEHEEIEGSHAFTRAWLQRKRLKIELCRVLTIEGDSMLPELRHGFVVLIDLSDCQPIKSGKVYALSVDGEQRIKRLFRQVDGSLLIRSDNPDKAHYPDEVVQPEHLDRVRIIGRKRWHAGDDD